MENSIRLDALTMNVSENGGELMKVNIRKFTENDIPNKIEWINNPENNKYLHYDLPLEYEKTVEWFERIKERIDRYDAVIEADGKPVGLIGLLEITDESAEYYVSMGETAYKGKGIASDASRLLLKYAFETLRLNEVYLYTEVENVKAQHLFSKIGFSMIGVRYNDVISHGKSVDRYEYLITKAEWFSKNELSHIEYIESINNNSIYFKRDDLIPYSFGGNKARKGLNFFVEIDNGDYDCVVTYGTSHSNHCRVIANMAAQRQLKCIIIAPQEVSDTTFNSRMVSIFGAEVITVPVSSVHDKIEDTINTLRHNGFKPYFIQGGGHGNIGTEAFVQCYEEIKAFEELNHTHFDYVFLASGTGTTQAGLVCGQLLYDDEREIVGISIARTNPRGREIVKESIQDYLDSIGFSCSAESIVDKTIFIDDYIADGYGLSDEKLLASNITQLIQTGIPLDSTYTGKAYYGMKDYLVRIGIQNKSILFLHTGGTPLFFDDLITLEINT